MGYDMLAIPKDSPHVENAYLFLDYILQEKVSADISNYVRYANANQASYKLIDPEILNNKGIFYDEKTLERMQIVVPSSKLERLMTNADRPPTRGWLNGFFNEVPWVDGFTGLRADGTVLGTEVPAGKPQVTVDYVPLLYEPAKQSTRALRGDMQQTTIGPVVVLAAPLYDGIDFLGVVATYFRISSIIDRVKKPDSVVVFTPHGLLWSPYEYGATPMAGIDWEF